MKTTVMTMALTILFATLGRASESDPEGLLSLTPVEEVSYIAMRVELPDSVPIAGIRWYNNDSGTVFPRVMLAAATEGGLPDLEIYLELGSDVTGNHLGWSELLTVAPIINDVGVLFVVFQLPAYGTITEQGSGPGIGYTITNEEPSVYLSSDAENWVAVGGGVTPEYETLPAASKSGATGIMFQRPEMPVWKTTLNRPHPNPFNPSTILEFTLAEPGDVDLAVYNLRGQRVVTLVHDHLDIGAHEAIWNGVSEAGSKVASGVYFVRMTTEAAVLNQRLVLLK